MELNLFKDKLFELLNENGDTLEVSDIETHDARNVFTVKMADGHTFEIECRQIK